MSELILVLLIQIIFEPCEYTQDLASANDYFLQAEQMVLSSQKLCEGCTALCCTQWWWALPVEDLLNVA